MSDELRRLLDVLDARAQSDGVAGECAPPFDLLETPGTVEVVMDLPGVEADALQVAFSRGTVLIAGIKRASLCSHADAAFHLAERTFGRFARAIRITGAVDGGRAKATLAAGELRIRFPRIAERRGSQITIAVETT